MFEDNDVVFRKLLSESIIEQFRDGRMYRRMSHRPVVKEGSVTRIRRVFDASAQEKVTEKAKNKRESGIIGNKIF